MGIVTKRDISGMTEEVYVYSVGECYPQFRGESDGYRLEYDSNGLWLYVLMRNWTPEERRAVQMDRAIEFRFVEIYDVGFLCVRFEGLNWGDCPFHPALCKEHDISMEQVELGKIGGLPLTIVCADTATGEILDLRLIGLGNDFSRKWLQWATDNYDVPVSRDKYERHVDTVYSMFSSDAIANRASLRWTLKA